MTFLQSKSKLVMSSLPSEAVVELCVDLQVPLLQPKWGAAALDAIACGGLGRTSWRCWRWDLDQIY